MHNEKVESMKKPCIHECVMPTPLSKSFCTKNIPTQTILKTNTYPFTVLK